MTPLPRFPKCMRFALVVALSLPFSSARADTTSVIKPEDMGRLRTTMFLENPNPAVSWNCYEKVSQNDFGLTGPALQQFIQARWPDKSDAHLRGLQITLLSFHLCNYRKLVEFVIADAEDAPSSERPIDTLLQDEKKMVTSITNGNLEDYLSATGVPESKAFSNIAGVLFDQHGIIEASHTIQEMAGEEGLDHLTAEELETVHRLFSDYPFLNAQFFKGSWYTFGLSGDYEPLYETIANFYPTPSPLVTPEDEENTLLEVEDEWEIFRLISEGSRFYLEESFQPKIVEIANWDTNDLLVLDRAPKWAELRKAYAARTTETP